MPLLAGCDPIYGISRGAPLAFEPDISCVLDAVKATPGVRSVEKKHYVSRDIVSGRDTITESFFFKGSDGDNVMGSLQVVNSQRQINYTNSLLQIGQPPPQAMIDASRPVMISMEAIMAKQCAMPELETGVKEKTWHGMQFWLN